MSRALVIVFDWLPAHWLGCYGNFDVTTPAFDWLATQSIVFDRHVANSPGTNDAAASLMTGRYPSPKSAFELPTSTRPEQIGEILTMADTGVAWLWMDAVDGPIDAHDDDHGESRNDRVDRCDEILVEALEQIEAAGWLDAMLIVTAASGSHAGQFPLNEASIPADSQDGHGLTDLHLPLLIRHPDVAGFRLRSITQPIDLVPTLIEWSGENTADAKLDGISLLPLISGRTDRIRDHGLFCNQTHAGIVVDDFVLVRARGDTSRASLFLQPHDRWLIHDVSVEYPEVADELSAVLDELIA